MSKSSQKSKGKDKQSFSELAQRASFRLEKPKALKKSKQGKKEEEATPVKKEKKRKRRHRDSADIISDLEPIGDLSGED